MKAEDFRPRDPESVGIDFPEGRRLRTSSDYPKPGASRPLVFFVVGILLGATALGAGYWFGGRQGTTRPPPPPPEEVTIEIKNFAFVPANVSVEPGTKVTWTNRDTLQHTATSDATGVPIDSPYLNQGDSWSFTFNQNGTYAYHCTPHPFMTGVVIVGSGGGGGGVPIDLPHDTYNATTTPPAPGGPEWNFTIRARELPVEIADGVPYAAWTFDGSVPGPVFRVRQGDRVNIRLINEGTIPHSIDFHSAQINWATAYKDVNPGQQHVYNFTANYPGVFMYHCGTAPVLAHVANGMYGVMIVDPLNDTRPAADREYALVLSEFYASQEVSAEGVYTGDFDMMLRTSPSHVVFNGYAFQYDPRKPYGEALRGLAGERIRLYVLNAGPSIVESFHVIGGIFDTVWIENNPDNPLYGIQTWTLPSSGGATFDIVFMDAGLYPFVTHNFAYTELGAIGVIQVT